ncbi:MAG: hypothetical protein HC866_11070 [Leptolyngbyaceae cyanobacterium RU_5_1]|nr:hypothetical protein [Leptolyngbyaceae cyanobacterium RU_5_1]
MSNSNFHNQPRSRDRATRAPDSVESSQLASPASIPLREQIKRGWDWVVFVWQMLQRLGGPLDILRTLGRIISILVTRLLVQLGVIKQGKR